MEAPCSQPAQQNCWPDGKRFAFTIVDDTDTILGDTDTAALERLRPVYDLLLDCGIKPTKTAWVLSGEKSGSCTVSLENDKYLRWAMDIRGQGAEIAIHGAAGSSSDREKTIRGFDFYRQVMGEDPRVHTNHVGNLDNIYWYGDRLVGAPSLAYKAYNSVRRGDRAVSLGHCAGSRYFWGDICRDRISYVRNFVFQDINTLRNDPWMPYHSARHPFVRQWFSASDGIDLRRFNELISERNQDRLMEEGGACIVYTHLAFGFTNHGEVDPRFDALIRRLSRMPGHFVPVSDLLSRLKASHGGEREICPSDLAQLQSRWVRDRVLAKASVSRLTSYNRRKLLPPAAVPFESPSGTIL